MTALLLLALLAQDADAADKKADEAVKAFGEAYKNSDALVRAAAVRTLAKTRHDKCLKILVRLLGQDDPLVRKEAALGLADYGEAKELREKAAGALLNGVQVNLKDDVVLEAVFTALGNVLTESTATALHRLFDHKRLPVAVGSVRAAGDARLKESIEPLLACLKQLERNRPPDDSRGKAPSSGYDEGPDRERWDKLRKPVLDALSSITGEHFEKAADYEEWWRKNKAGFRVPERKKPE